MSSLTGTDNQVVIMGSQAGVVDINHATHLYYNNNVVCGLSFSRSQPDFEGFLGVLRFPPSSKSTPIWRACLSMGIWVPPTTVPLTNLTK